MNTRKILSILLFALITLIPLLAKAEVQNLNADMTHIRQVADRHVFGKIVLPPYTGDHDDSEYLKKYISSLAATTYHVSETVFDHPTLFSTTLLRDLVSKVNDSQPPENKFDTLFKLGKTKWKPRKDIGEMWRYPSSGVCGHTSWSLYNIYKSFGYKTNRINTVNGTKESYTASHSMTEVYVEDLKKYVMQDPSFNMYATDESGTVLSFDELRDAILIKKTTPSFVTLLFTAAYPYNNKLYDAFPMTPIPYPELNFTLDINNVRQNYYNTVFRKEIFDGDDEIIMK